MSVAQGDTVRLRPSLIFAKKHAELFLDRMESVLKEM